MQQLDLQVIQQARDWLAQGRPVWLCTVLSTYGSAPRGPGAMLVALAGGEHRGSLSGGCIEEDFLQRLADGTLPHRNQRVRYGEGGFAPNLVLPCGGVLDVLVEYLSPRAEVDRHLASVERALSAGPWLIREVSLHGQLPAQSPGSLSHPRVAVTPEQVSIRIGAVHRLLLAGLSPVAEFCASFALALGYEVILCEPRTELLAGFCVPGVEVCPVLPARYIEQGGCHAATAVVALTHDPRLDDLTLMEAVRSEAFYIGAMGSRQTSHKRMERLQRIGGLDARALARIHAPIGLNLGSKTPAEIALAVMADILASANGMHAQQVWSRST
ncbi:XdhC family protein [Pseudomonas sp. 21LCFQ010]|uniref:XdhC family protein n=1 Tax=Pseudomonas sp. 21LCFQ010 TaxID=2957506 RepID=UPI002097618D|nr:XdhC family protein [Pseudomonas sp. 21LCFQ010]MCO8163794.1 XdhC family protein [Pseudomonas sp. 21LCFQ010]